MSSQYLPSLLALCVLKLSWYFPLLSLQHSYSQAGVVLQLSWGLRLGSFKV